MSKVWVSTLPTPKMNSGAGEKVLGELHPIADVSGLDLIYQLEEEMLRSKCLTESGSMPRMPIELAGQ